MKYILMQFEDIKTKEFRNALKKHSINLYSMPSLMLLPMTILKKYIKNGKPEVVIFRYLNDYKSISKTLIRTLSEIISVILVLFLRINLVWICHNVDRESRQFYPKISKFRRTLFAKKSSKILVMDPLLMQHAKKVFPQESDKIGYLTFGESIQRNNSPESRDLIDRIRTFANDEKAKLGIESKRCLIASCIGNPNEKNLSYERIINLLDIAESKGYHIRVILIGPIGKYLSKKNPYILQKLKNDSRILFVDRVVKVDEQDVSKYIDFYWRVYNDLSVPYTVYHAAALHKPILTQGRGFLGEMIEKYKIGEVLDEDFNNLPEKLMKIQKNENYDYESFLRTHNWEESSINLLKNCGIR